MIGSMQFGRFVEVEIRDFENNRKTTIGNDFEISFDYFKSLDQNKEDDSGTIQIYGLTPETIKSLQVVGGEVVLRCGYQKSSIEVLFIASIIRLYYDNDNNTTVTTIECSSNLLDYYYTGSVTSENIGKTSIGDFFLKMSKSLGNDGVNFDLSVVPSDKLKAVEEFIKTYSINISQVGHAATLIETLSEALGMAARKGIIENNKVIIFTLSQSGLDKILKSIDSGYPKIKEVSQSEYDTDIFYSTIKASDESRSLTILDYSTGLISEKTEFKIAYTKADQSLNNNEEETVESIKKRREKAAKESAKEAKEIQKEIDAKKNGKKYKPPKKKTKKEEFIKISRRYNRVKALLNPKVLPQSMVAVPDSDAEKGVYDGIRNEDTVESGVKTDADINAEFTVYRVRSASYKGNNRSGEWIMDLFCEDSETKSVSEAEARNLNFTAPNDGLGSDLSEDSLQQLEE